jgi:hypothetical protein
MTVWLLPPELARQDLSFVLKTWVKQPLTTAALMVQPLQASSTLIKSSSAIHLCFQFQLPFCIFLLTLVLCQQQTGWTELSFPQRPDDTGNRQLKCMGCLLGLSDDPFTLKCYPADSGFDFEGRALHPCGTAYHTGYIIAGAPFASHACKQAGLTFPKVHHQGPFICEAFTVQSVLGRVLPSASGGHPMAFERMRLLDMAHSWSVGLTHPTKLS